ncbi:hypothetical protein Tco_1161938, partial [Tanacetum coccineum]
MDVFDGWKQKNGSVLPIHKKLIDAKLRIWVYRMQGAAWLASSGPPTARLALQPPV